MIAVTSMNHVLDTWYKYILYRYHDYITITSQMMLRRGIGDVALVM